MKFRKKPVVIDAIQLNRTTFQEICDWIGLENLSDGTDQGECYVGIQTLEGEMEARENDWVIKGIKGEFYPCKPDIFKATYDSV